MNGGAALALGLQLVLCAAGLLVTGGITALVLHLWRGRPVASYRAAVVVLCAALTLPALQALAPRWGVGLDAFTHRWLDRLDALADREAPSAARALAPLSDEDLSLLLAALSADAESRDATTAERAAAHPLRQRLAHWGERAAPLLRVACASWAIVAAALLLTTARRLARTHALVRRARPVLDARVRHVWDRVVDSSRLRGRVRLVRSSEIRAPACVALGAPVVVLPEGPEGPGSEGLTQRADWLTPILTHELVHLERRDGWVQLGEEVLRALFWFHPTAWWLRARLGRLREESCDRLVVQRTGSRRRYAAALVEFAAWMQTGPLGPTRDVPLSAAVLPWSPNKGQLARRIEMLLQREPASTRASRWIAPTAVGALFASLWGGQMALAAGSSSAAAVAGDTCPCCRKHQSAKADSSESKKKTAHVIVVEPNEATEGEAGGAIALDPIEGFTGTWRTASIEPAVIQKRTRVLSPESGASLWKAQVGDEVLGAGTSDAISDEDGADVEMWVASPRDNAGGEPVKLRFKRRGDAKQADTDAAAPKSSKRHEVAVVVREDGSVCGDACEAEASAAASGDREWVILGDDGKTHERVIVRGLAGLHEDAVKALLDAHPEGLDQLRALAEAYAKEAPHGGVHVAIDPSQLHEKLSKALSKLDHVNIEIDHDKIVDMVAKALKKTELGKTRHAVDVAKVLGEAAKKIQVDGTSAEHQALLKAYADVALAKRQEATAGTNIDLQIAEQVARGLQRGSDGDVDALRKQLEDTRAKLEAQRAEIEALRKALEDMQRERTL